jgi:hypothetical protein
MALLNCNATYKQDVPGCIDFVALNFDLESSTEYQVTFTFANGMKLTTRLTTNGGGVINLTKDVLLDGFWNDGTGEIVIQIYALTDLCTPVILSLCENDYSQIVLNFTKILIDSDYRTENVPCCS